MTPASQTAHPSSIPHNFCHTQVFDWHPLATRMWSRLHCFCEAHRPHLSFGEHAGLWGPHDFSLYMSLCCHFIMCTKNKSPFNIIRQLNGKLCFNIPNGITNQTWLITFHGGEKFILTVWQDIRVVMTIRIQALCERWSEGLPIAANSVLCSMKSHGQLGDEHGEIIPPPYISLGPEVFLHERGDANIYQLHWEAVHSCWIASVSLGSWPTCLSRHMPKVLQQ